MKPFCGYVNGIWGSKGGREQRGSKQVAWTESFSQIRGLFQGFGAFLAIRGLFGDSGPFSGIRALFRGFMAFFWDSRPFRGFLAFLRIHGLFTDSRPFHRFTDSRPRRGAKGANETWRNFRYLIFLYVSDKARWGNVKNSIFSEEQIM